MSKIIPGNQKHLSLEDRLFIMQSLNQGLSFKEIAKYLCKDPSSISKEVKKHQASNWYHKGSFLNKRNFCVHRFQCRKTNGCRKIVLCGIKCISCPSRNQTCKDFKKEARKKRQDHYSPDCKGTIPLPDLSESSRITDVCSHHVLLH